MNRFKPLLLALALISIIAVGGAGASASPATAAPIGSAISLNPGGGVAPDGTDGVRFQMNTGIFGEDSVIYRNTTQYCCSAAAPMLNIGGTLFGQASAAINLNSQWTSLEVLDYSGSTSIGGLTSATGDATATVRYTAVKDGFTYLVDRSVSYTYPNDYVTESYTFVIPEGNTETVKFYQGGDTAPGNSDSANGLMLTTPVRSAISVNRDSQIMLGYREVAGSKPFDGARAASFYTPYAIVEAGGDIGFVEETSRHDAGLMMQWTLGNTPGTYTAAMQTFATKQGVNLTASTSTAIAAAGQPFTLDFSVANTQTSEALNLDFTFALPAGLALDGAPTNSCNGAVSTTTGSVTLTGGTVAATSNCVLSVDVVAATPGTYAFSGINVTSASGLTNTVGAQSVLVGTAPVWQTPALASLTVGITADEQLETESDSPVTYALVGDGLPSGISLSTTGTLTGLPTVAGTFPVTVTATNTFGSTEQVVAITVARGTTSLTGSLTPTEISYGDQAVLAVANAPSGATGTVVFTSGSTVLCTADLSAPSCATAIDLPAGDYENVRANYSGDDNWLETTVPLGSLTVTSLPVQPPAATPSPAAPSLSVTGAELSPWLAGGGLLLGLSGLALLVIRLVMRRRSA